VPHFNGLAILSSMKGNKRGYVLLRSVEEATNKEYLESHIFSWSIFHILHFKCNVYCMVKQAEIYICRYIYIRVLNQKNL
jgi:hypothetical protein